VPAAAQTITLTSSIPGLVYSAAANVPWLTITPIDGTSPASLQVIADPTQLSAGTSSGIITITAPAAVPPVQQVAVTFQIGAATPGRLGLSSTGLSFSLSPRASPATKLVTALNLGSGSIRFSATATTASGGSWLSVTPNSGTTSPASPASLTITATPGSLALGTYSGSITVSSADTGQQISITVTLAITGPPQKILLSQVGFAFTAVAQGAPALPQQLGILNAGAGTLNYTVQATTRPGASGWLKVSATSGTVNRPLLDVLFVDVIVDASSLAPGAYYGQVQVVAAGASNSPQSALVVLTVLPSGQNPGPDVRPTGLVFTGIAGANPGSQIVTVANVTASPIAFGSSIAYVGAGGWIQYKPTDATVNPGAPVSVVVQPDFSTLSVGPHRAALTLAFDDGSFQVVSILAVVASAGGGTSTGRKPGDRFDSSCIPTKLLPQFTQVGFGGAPGVGFPVAVVTKIVDDCGSPLTGGSVTASFDNGDLPLGLVSLQDGTWTQTWQPHYATNTVTITVDARQGNLSGQTRSAGLSLQTRQPPPLLSGGPLSATTLSEGPLAPGDLILIRGSGLASGQAAATSAPLGQLLAGASVVIGGSLATLLYADATQIVGVVPPDVPVNTEQQLILQRDNTAGVPISLIIATTHPAVLSKDGSGRGQALAYKSTGSASLLADSANPVSAGDSLILYCSGLGATSTSGVVTNLPVVTIGGLPAPVTYAGVALPANYPASGAPTVVGGLAAPGFGGLYQITATVPSGLATGQGEVLVSSAGQASFSGVTIAVTGSGTPGAPVITSVGTVGGFAGIAQNTWVEIKGINLAPSIVGAGMTWEKAPEFASNRMPTQLGGVSVAINGKSAFVYFISPTQLNVLTPLDDTIGPVQITVTNGGSSSPVFSATLRAAAPSFPLFGATRYIAAAHADGRLLVGPTSLSAPGFPFLPAQPGEAITIYAYGLGLPATTLVNGSASQSGELPAKPPIQIGGLTAEVSFAGLIGPGLYQINLVVPAAAPNGDNSVTCSYAGQTSPAGDLLLVQR
jgi:uncharacterized protein (TIGR03437 family)